MIHFSSYQMLGMELLYHPEAVWNHFAIDLQALAKICTQN